MILTQLQSLDMPWPKKRPVLTRKLKTTKIKIRRLIKPRYKKARSKTLSVIRRQYFITTAARDMQKAVRLNEDIFIASALVMAILAYSFISIAFETFILFLKTAYDVAGVMGGSILPAMLFMVTALSLLGCWISAFAFNSISLSLMDGLNRKLHRSFRGTLRRGLQYATRITATWFLLAALIAVPLGIAALIASMIVQAFGIPLDSVLEFLPSAAVMVVSWIVFAAMQFSLAPTVALFEPGLELHRVFMRSQRLVRQRGRLFILAGYGLITLVLTALYKLSAQADTSLGFNKWGIFFLTCLPVLVAANGIMVMLYRKRKLARK